MNQVFHDLVNEIYNEEVKAAVNLTIDNSDESPLKELKQWKVAIDEYIDTFCVQNDVSALILTTAPLISSTASAPNNLSAEKFVRILETFKLPLATNGFKDFTAKYAREQLKFLFVDVSLGNDNATPEDFNRTIIFVNKLIAKLFLSNPRCKVIDMRENGSKEDLNDLNENNYHHLGDPLKFNVVDLENVKKESGCELTKLYYKPGFNELVDQIANDPEFKKLKIQTKIKERAPIVVKKHLSVWLTNIRENFLTEHYSHFNFDELEMIVLSSSGVKNYLCHYNSLRALVADDDYTGIPHAVKNFITYLNRALSRKVEGVVKKGNSNYDFKCEQLKKRVLFINACLSHKHFADQEWVNAACTIMFVNKILDKLCNVRKIAILDVRMVMHTHKDNLKSGNLETLIENLNPMLESLKQNINPTEPDESIFNNVNSKYRDLLSIIDTFKSETICQDVTTNAGNYYYQVEDCFKIVNPITEEDPNGYHRYVRLGNPGELHYHKSDEAYCAEQLRQLHQEGYPIDQLFEPKQELELEN